jgi:hypothetical protein
MKRLLMITSITLLGFFALWLTGRHPNGFVQNVQAQSTEQVSSNEREQERRNRCSPRTMKGTHGYSYSGTVLGAEIAAAGPITFDGYGNLHATYNVNLGGKSFKGGFVGTYIVNDDCTGIVTLHLPVLGLSSNGSFVIVNDGKETFFTGTDTGVAITGVTKKL